MEMMLKKTGAVSLRCCLIVAVVLTTVATQSVFAQRKSAKRDINAPFRNPDVKRFVKVFEHEGRAIYDKRAEVLKACGIKPGVSVADIGAGTGLFTRLFARQVGPKGRVYAVDIAKKFVDYTIETCRKQKLDNVVGVVCSDKSVELPPDSIDVAFICDTYHHFEHPLATMRSVHEALRPGGVLFVIDFKRVKGTSRDWIMKHVRAGEEVFTKEIESAGFEKVDEYDLFKENYFLKFRKKATESLSSGETSR